MATLFADTLVTIEDQNGIPDYGAPLKIEAKFPGPYRAIAAQLRMPHRKVYALSNTSAFACAGYADKIAQFLSEAQKYPDQLDSLPIDMSEGGSMPLDSFCILANNYGGLEAIGLVARLMEDNTLTVNYMFSSNLLYESPFGEICYAGSGSSGFLHAIRVFGNQTSIKTLIRRQQPLQIVFELRNMIAQSAFDQAFARFERAQSPPSWGGLVEILVRDYQGGGWSWAPPVIHLFCQAFRNLETPELSVTQVPIFIEPNSAEATVKVGIITASGYEFETVPIICSDVGIPVRSMAFHNQRVAVIHVRTDRGGLIDSFLIMDELQSGIPGVLSETLCLNEAAFQSIQELYFRTFV